MLVAPTRDNAAVIKLRQSLVSAYNALTHDQLSLFCTLRSLPKTGDLCLTLANHDILHYGVPRSLGQTSTSTGLNETPSLTPGPIHSPALAKPNGPDLPVELISEILDNTGDWELASSVGVPTSLTKPLEWTRASIMDEAILSGYLPMVRTFANTNILFTRVGANAALRFGFIHIIEHLKIQHRKTFDEVFGKDGRLIPLKASQYGRVQLLQWWKNCPDFPEICDAEMVDAASKAGAVASLEWWHRHSGLQLSYSEGSLEGASLRGHLDVLNWWKDSGLPLKIGKVMESASTSGEVAVLDWWAQSGLELPKYDKQALYHASCHQRVTVLQWWLDSGLQMIYDADVLTGATRMNRPAVLEWWDRSGLPVPYRLCDIEEALEDAIGGGEEARAWWKQKGVDFNAADAEWMKMQYLN